jgi:hypothetical protein
MRRERIAVLLASLLAGSALADPQGVSTYTYDVSGFDAIYWWVAADDYRHDLVQWATTTRSAVEPYPLNGAGGGWSYRRKGDYPGFVLGENGWQRSVDGNDQIVGTGASYDNTPVPTDRTIEMYYRGNGHYAGVTGAVYSTTPRAVAGTPVYDANGNFLYTDWSRGTTSGNWAGYLSVPITNGRPPAGSAYTLTRTYQISGTEYGTFTDAAADPAPAYVRQYTANFDQYAGPGSQVDMPFRIDSITRAFFDNNTQPFPRDVYRSDVTFEGPRGTLIGQYTGYRDTAGFHLFSPETNAIPRDVFDTSGYAEFITVFTGGTGVFEGARGVIIGWQQGMYEPGSATPRIITHWSGYLSIPENRGHR